MLLQRSPFLGTLALALAVSALVLSCEASSGLLSLSERNSLYTLEIDSNDGPALSNGMIVYPGTSIVAFVSKKYGAGDPGSLDFSLTAADSAAGSSLRFLSPAGDVGKSLAASSSTAGASKVVPRIDGKLEGFVVPADAAPGEYELSVSLEASDGSSLQNQKVRIFVGREEPVIDSVSTFPPSVEPGSSVLLELTISWRDLSVPADLNPPQSTAIKTNTPSRADASAHGGTTTDSAASSGATTKTDNSASSGSTTKTDSAQTGTATTKTDSSASSGATVKTDGAPTGTATTKTDSSATNGAPTKTDSAPAGAATTKPDGSSPGATSTQAEPSSDVSNSGSSRALGATPSLSPAIATAAVAVDAASAKPSARDPYIRWSRDGVAFSEGLLSEGFDKAVWNAPRIEGAYSITAEVFPSAPAKGSYPFRSLSSQNLKVMVITPPGGSGSDFADPLNFYSLLKFNGSFEDSGTRPRSAQPESFGTPKLDTYSSGFGYRFGAKAGVRVPGIMPPSSSETPQAFAILMRLAFEGSSGTLVRFASDDGAYSLALGVEDGMPYVEARAGGKTQRSVARSELRSNPLTLEAVFKPVGDEYSIAWYAEGDRIDAPPLQLPSAPREGGAIIGGEDSLPGVYDGFGFMIANGTDPFPSPTYRLAARRQWKTALILAESFEDGLLPPKSTGSPGAAVADDRLALEPGASLSFGAAFGVGTGIAIDTYLEGDAASCLVGFSAPGGGSVFSVRGTGEVLDAAGKTLGSIPIAGGHIAFNVAQKDGSLSLVGPGGSVAAVVPNAPRKLSVSLRRDAGAGSAAFDRILIRSISSSGR